MSEAEERQVVQIGVDLRPVPLRLPGEEVVWLFNADPDVEFFASLEKVGTSLEGDGEDRWESVNTMREILTSALVQPAQRKAFAERKYGLAGLMGLARAYTEQVVGTPTQSSSASGGGPKRRGARK